MAERRCRICDTLNGAGLRYCTSCGSTLDPAPAGAARPAPAPPPPPPTAIPSPAQAIVPMGVVHVAGGSGRETTRTCSRCKGIADGAAQFCKFCGNALPEPSTSSAGGAARGNGTHDRSSGSGRPQTAPLAEAHPAGGPLRPMPSAHSPAPSASPIGPSVAVERVSTHGSHGSAAHASGAAALAAIPLRDGSRSVPTPGAAAPVPSAAARGPAATPQRGRLVVIAKSGADGPSYPFGDLLDIGRVEGNVIVGEDPYLSPRHVRLLWNAGKLTLRDLGSTNGVYLRLAASRDTGPRRAPDNTEITVPLVDQDLILVGQQVLRFDILRENEGGFGPAQEHGTLLFGSPAAPRYARLCQRTVEGIARDVYYIRKVETVLGRESGDVVFTEDPFLSRRHAAIRLLSRDGLHAATGSRPPPPGEARFALVDLGSSNGTFLRVRGDVELTPGDHFRVGQQLFRVDFDGARE